MKNAVFWTFWFIAIVVIAIVYLFSSDHSSLSLLGLPEWIFYFFLIEIVFAFSIWAFCRRFWQDEKPDQV